MYSDGLCGRISGHHYCPDREEKLCSLSTYDYDLYSALLDCDIYRRALESVCSLQSDMI